jgi:two-component system alkaline phosphatase synthesis response regulator PhoP
MNILTKPEQKKVIVIDDNVGILFGIKEALKFKGYDVFTFETYNGVDEIEKIAPDLIFLDISLVGCNGREVSLELKSDKRTKNIPIILITAQHNAEEIVKEARANDLLAKPFELEDLWSLAEKHTAKKMR